MKIYRAFALPRRYGPKTVLAIGNFDGLHLGHQKILRTLVRTARRRGWPSCVLTFSPHPEKMFGTRDIGMLQTLDQRLEGLCRAGVEMTVVAPFRRPFAVLSPREFAERILCRTLKAGVVIVGSGFRFGKDRRGDLDMLTAFGHKYGFEVQPVAPVRHRGAVVSSSRLRSLLKEGRVARAAELLGRPYAIEGDVVPGRRRGRKLGFPTANIETPNEIVPPGVFLTWWEMDGVRHPSVTNVGNRPTFRSAAGRRSAPASDGSAAALRPTIESHLLDFGKKIYGRSVTLTFLKKVRDERVFRSSEALARQIAKDVAAARQYFKNMV